MIFVAQVMTVMALQTPIAVTPPRGGGTSGGRKVKSYPNAPRMGLDYLPTRWAPTSYKWSYNPYK